MKILVQIIPTAALLISAFGFQPSAFAQGSLTPSGSPAVSMKTLAQIEPRTPISSAPFIITQAGSYYLTTNVTVATGDAITIATNGVALDLNGFTIASTTPIATGYAIRLNSGLRNLTVCNGFIQSGTTNNGSGVYDGPGFVYGIDYFNPPTPMNTRIAGISVSGCAWNGIRLGLGDSTVVESCTVRTMGNDGIIADTIRSSMALDCGGQGISGSSVSESRGESTSTHDGVDAAIARDCSGVSSGGQGIYTTTAENCTGTSTSNYGVLATIAQNCSGYSASGPAGLYCTTALNCYGGTSLGTYGLYAATAQNCSAYNYGAGTGLRVTDLAIGCRGSSTSGIGITAYLANSCRVIGGTTNITYKYNMP